MAQIKALGLFLASFRPVPSALESLTIWYVSNISHQHRYLTFVEYQFEIRKRHYAAHLGYTRYSCCYCGERMFRRDHTMKHLKENHAIIRPVINQDFNDVSLEFP